MRRPFTSMKARTALACAALALTSSRLTAQLTQQQTDDIISRYLDATTRLTASLGNIRDADMAQRTALDLEPLIEKLNPLVQQMKSVYGSAASQSSLQRSSEQVTRAQNDLQREQVRLLTGNCALAATAKSLNANTAIQVTFINNTQKPLTLYWVGYDGKIPATGGTLQPGQSYTGNTFVTHPFLVNDPSGACFSLLLPDRSGNLPIVGSLAPTLGSFLAKIAK